MVQHAAHLLATSAAKGLFWVCVCVCVAAAALSGVGVARQQPLLGSEALWGLRLPLCLWAGRPRTPNEPL